MKTPRQGKTGDFAAKRSATIQSVAMAFRFLDLLSEAEGPLVLGEIARRGRTGASTAHRYMRSLVQEGLAAQDELGRYDLGPAALRIGVRALRRIEPVEIAARSMQIMAAGHAASCGVAIWTERGPTIVRWYRSAGFTISTVTLGDVLPLDSTACGLVFQAYLPADMIASARRRQPAAFRGSAPRSDELVAIREAGIAELDERLFRQLTGKAAPVFNALGEIACVVATVSHVEVAEKEGHRAALCEAARRSSREAGGP